MLSKITLPALPGGKLKADVGAHSNCYRWLIFNSPSRKEPQKKLNFLCGSLRYALLALRERLLALFETFRVGLFFGSCVVLFLQSLFSQEESDTYVKT